MAIPTSLNPEGEDNADKTALNDESPVKTQQELDLDAVFAEEEAEKKAEDDHLEKVKRDSDRKKIAIIAVAILAVVLLAGSLFLIKGGDNGKDGKADPKDSQSGKGTKTKPKEEVKEDAVSAAPFWAEEGKAFPKGVAPKYDWQNASANSFEYAVDGEGKPLSDEEKAKLENKITQEVGDYNLLVPGTSESLQSLPSRSAGATDDISQFYLEDGTMNPDYSYWTLEGFNESVNAQLQRFVNPVFGDWTSYQYASAKKTIEDPDQLLGRFVNSYDRVYLDSVKDKPLSSWLPVYADWNGNDYGLGDKLLPEPAPRWMGKLDRVDVTFAFDEGTSEATAHVEASVTYEAWTKNQQSIKKTGKISFDVLPGFRPGDDFITQNSNRYVLSNSKLEIS